MAEVFNMELRDGAEEEEISDEEYPQAESHPQVLYPREIISFN